MYVKKTLMLFLLFIFMVLISTNPVKVEPVLFMDEKTKGNAIKDLDLNLQSDEIAMAYLELDSGEATLLQDKSGNNVLINTGSGLSKSQFRQQMKIFQVDRIDTLILTNIGKQYTGNLAWLLDKVEVDHIYVAENIRDDFISQFKPEQDIVHPLKKGAKLSVFNQLSIEVGYIETRSEFNEGGLALLLQYGKHRFLYMGVASKEADQAIIERGWDDVELLKVGGFGHYFGTSERLLNQINPQVAVIFKRYGYTPSREVLTRLEDHWTETLLPYEQGIVMVKCSKNTYEITEIPLITPEMAIQ